MSCGMISCGGNGVVDIFSYLCTHYEDFFTPYYIYTAVGRVVGDEGAVGRP